MNYQIIDLLLLWYINNIECQKRLSFLCFIYKIVFDKEYDNNLLCCNNCIYKYIDYGNNIFKVNIYGIKKKHFLNYLTIFEYQALFINKVLKDKLRRKNFRPISFPN